jgi:hypothetical protein
MEAALRDCRERAEAWERGEQRHGILSSGATRMGSRYSLRTPLPRIDPAANSGRVLSYKDLLEDPNDVVRRNRSWLPTVCLGRASQFSQTCGTGSIPSHYGS